MENTLIINESQNWIKDQEKNDLKIGDHTFVGVKQGFFARLFGCWHKNISRPFNHGEQFYRSCLECGARQQFDPKTLQTFGAFYFPPVKAEHHV